MAEDTATETAEPTEMPPVMAAEKKTRKRRVPKAEASTGDATAVAEKPIKKTRAKRGSKMLAGKAENAVGAMKTTAVRAPQVEAAASAPVDISADLMDDIADLIKLEEENRQLRKELATKLRAENADLRKRLGKA